MNLWQIDDAILNCIDTETGEIVDEEKLAELELARDTKIENIAKWIKNLESDITALKEQEDAFKARRVSAEKKVESLRRYLQGYLDGEQWMAMDQSIVISYRKSKSVSVVDESQIPDEYFREMVTRDVDKQSIMQALKEGKEIAGAVLEEKQNMQIR